MRFLKILILLFLFEEYQCKDTLSINKTQCEFTKKRRIPGKTVAENITSRITFLETNKYKSATMGTKLTVKTVLKPVFEIIKKVDCCPGYKKQRNSCIPKCDLFCENSECTAPNHCECLDGFKKLSPNRCIPYCENCERGRCVSPNICECYNGYQKNDTGQCVPICEKACINGWCSEPNVCSCDPGYELDQTDQYKCYPNCTIPCIQGKCVAPDVCDCHPGYEFKNGSKTECLPICDFCESGNCTGPSKCTCWDNYEEQEILQGSNIVKICQPKCEMDCVNGVCIEVDTCSCYEGYEFLKDSFNECEPICDPPCLNGNCVKPNVCECDPGYDNIDGQCYPHCDKECVNGYCIYPNQCECMSGYKLVLNSVNVCEAHCENSCTHGICLKPNYCECLEGFKVNENNICEKMCLPDCIFGECVNGTCVCESGFYLLNDSTYNCQPVPDKPCVNESCSGNNTCSCEGLELSDEMQCSPPCENGECMGNQCVCPDGYQIDYVKINHCEPICGNDEEGCINGTCILPKICECYDDFEIHPSSPFVCVLKGVAAMKNAPFKGIVNYVNLILALLVIVFSGITLIWLVNRRHRKINYNVDEKEKKVGVAPHVHYVINKDIQAFA